MFLHTVVILLTGYNSLWFISSIFQGPVRVRVRQSGRAVVNKPTTGYEPTLAERIGTPGRIFTAVHGGIIYSRVYRPSRGIYKLPAKIYKPPAKIYKPAFKNLQTVGGREFVDCLSGDSSNAGRIVQGGMLILKIYIEVEVKKRNKLNECILKL